MKGGTYRFENGVCEKHVEDDVWEEVELTEGERKNLEWMKEVTEAQNKQQDAEDAGDRPAADDQAGTAAVADNVDQAVSDDEQANSGEDI